MDEINIRGRYQDVLERIHKAAQSTGRDPDEIRLVVVTKAQPLGAVRQVVEAGARLLGENYADQAVPRIQALSEFHDLEWHMVGHVQSRKASLVCEHFDYVHSLDRMKIARRFDRYAGEWERKLPVLLEYNVSGESSKYGWQADSPGEWPSLLGDVENILAFPNLEVRGLMTIAPYSDDPETARPYFRQLRKLRDFLARNFPGGSWDALSMGMSSDFEVAIQEGATILRIGQAILGPRPYE
jgi:pyridoxal phosphate enzyme (YggS family)